MNPLTGPTDTTTPGEVKISARLLWSQRRAWHGDKVKMLLRTELVKDNTDVELQVLTSTDVEIDKVTGKKITAAALDNDEYEIAWKDKPFADKREFKLAAKVGVNLQAAQSPMLYVDLDDPVFSA
jgi:hypothetical protein